MSSLQAFLLGVMAIVTPSLVIVALLIRRAPILDEDMNPVDAESRELLHGLAGKADAERLPSDDAGQPAPTAR
jgi:hypothetical protein